MTQSDAPNEGRENKTAVDFLIEFSPTPKAGYEDTWILRSMEAYKKQETDILRDQLSKEREKNAKLKLLNNITKTELEVEREMRKELVNTMAGIANSPECPRIIASRIYREITSMTKASELDKNN